MTEATGYDTPALVWQDATIMRIERRSTRLSSFFLRLSRPFDHRAGQHVEVRLTAPDGYAARRAYSIASAPGEGGMIELGIERLENGEVSPTAAVLGKLCAAYGLTLSRLMLMVEEGYVALVPKDAQPVWTDAATGFRRRSVSPPAQPLAGEVLECELDAGVEISYEHPPRAGLEHHLLLTAGRLRVTVNGESHDLKPGDCLRYQLFGPSRFETPAKSSARYFLFIV